MRRVGVDPVADPRDGRLDEVGRRPRRLDPGDAPHEVAQDVLAARGVDDLGMELDAVQVTVRRLQPGVRRRIALRGRDEALGQPGDRVAVAHPDRLLAIEPVEQAVAARERHVRGTVLAACRRQDVAAELAGHQLGAVADAQDRDPAAPHRGIRLGRVLVVDGVRTAGQDDRAGAAALELRVRGVVRQELGVDVELADAAGDQLRELAAEVEDDDRSRGGRPAGRRYPAAPGPVPAP